MNEEGLTTIVEPQEAGVQKKFTPEIDGRRGFEWFHQVITPTTHSPLFHSVLHSVAVHTEKTNGKIYTGLHGILFSDDTFVWSLDVPNHEALELGVQAELGEIEPVAEIELGKLRDQQMIIDIRGKTEESSKMLASHLSHNSDTTIRQGMLTIHPAREAKNVRYLYSGTLGGYSDNLVASNPAVPTDAR